MSPFFVKKFKKAHGCSSCKADQVSGYKMCENHLRIARERWRTWAFDRRSIGRCISCDRKGRKATRDHFGRGPGDREQRCTVHAEYNTKKMRRWVSTHPNAAREAYSIMLKIRDAGFCPRCPGHEKRPLPAGRHRCDPCRLKSTYGRFSAEYLGALKTAPQPIHVSV